MKLLVLITAITFSFLSFSQGSGTHAHGAGPVHNDHGAPKLLINKTKALELGKSHLQRLVSKGKIEVSWKEAKLDKAIKKTFGRLTEWVVTFDNVKGLKGKKVYIFLSQSGEFVAANYSGK